MEQTTQSPPATVDKAAPERPPSSTRPLPATEEDLRRRPSRTQSSGFRIAVAIAIIVLVVAGFFAYRYFSSYESTTTLRSTATSIPSAPASQDMSPSSTFKTTSTCRRELYS